MLATVSFPGKGMEPLRAAGTAALTFLLDGGPFPVVSPHLGQLGQPVEHQPGQPVESGGVGDVDGEALALAAGQDLGPDAFTLGRAHDVALTSRSWSAWSSAAVMACSMSLERLWWRA